MDTLKMPIKKIKKIFNHRDYMLISKQLVANLIIALLPKSKVRCDLTDRNGRIGILIRNVEENHTKKEFILELQNSEKITLHDRYLYNIIYNNIRSEYSLIEHDEYYEKIEIR